MLLNNLPEPTTIDTFRSAVAVRDTGRPLAQRSILDKLRV